MPDREELGRRIKRIRESKHLTLKDIEAGAGISATHISEIERGKTSPTLGALLRISRALGANPSYFVEEEELGDTSVVTAENRLTESLDGGAGTIERLTMSIPGARLVVCAITLHPGRSHRAEAHEHFGNEAALILSGIFRFTVATDVYELSGGDAIHYNVSDPHSYENASGTDKATMLWISTARGVT